MTADALAPCVAKSTASMILTVQDKYILVFLKKIFQLTAPSQCWEMIQIDANIFLFFLKGIHHGKS